MKLLRMFVLILIILTTAACYKENRDTLNGDTDGAIYKVKALDENGDTVSYEEPSADEAFEIDIEEKLNNIIKQPSASSNPYDYIKDGQSNEDYKLIVSQGEKSLNYMLNKFAISNENGLKEYIMAIACSEILNENPELKNWSTGREWYDNYSRK